MGESGFTEMYFEEILTKSVHPSIHLIECMLFVSNAGFIGLKARGLSPRYKANWIEASKLIESSLPIDTFSRLNLILSAPHISQIDVDKV